MPPKIKVIQTSDGPKLHDGKRLKGSLPKKTKVPKVSKTAGKVASTNKSSDKHNSLISRRHLILLGRILRSTSPRIK